MSISTGLSARGVADHKKTEIEGAMPLLRPPIPLHLHNPGAGSNAPDEAASRPSYYEAADFDCFSFTLQLELPGT
jgi:hypothetical protein